MNFSTDTRGPRALLALDLRVGAASFTRSANARAFDTTGDGIRGARSASRDPSSSSGTTDSTPSTRDPTGWLSCQSLMFCELGSAGGVNLAGGTRRGAAFLTGLAATILAP